MTQPLKIGSRSSLLALTQSRWVKSELKRFHPDLEVEIIEISTTGDQKLAASLQELGGKGAFTLELEQAMLDGSADIAVHSLKDLPTDLPVGLKLLCTPLREQTHDVIVFRDPLPGGAEPSDPLAHLSEGAVVGTSSLRRKAQLLAARPDLKVVEFRGNVGTRLDKLNAGQVDATLLAAAGLLRLGLLDDQRSPQRVDGRFDALPLGAAIWYPAVGQGALGIEGRAQDERVARLLAPLHDAGTFAAAAAERAFLNELGAGCQAPVGALAVAPEGSSLKLAGAILSVDGTRIVEGEGSGDIAHPDDLGRSIARDCLGRGAQELLP